MHSRFGFHHHHHKRYGERQHNGYPLLRPLAPRVLTGMGCLVGPALAAERFSLYLFSSAFRWRRRSWRNLLGLIVVMAALGTLSACGGGGGGSGRWRRWRQW